MLSPGQHLLFDVPAVTGSDLTSLPLTGGFRARADTLPAASMFGPFDSDRLGNVERVVEEIYRLLQERSALDMPSLRPATDALPGSSSTDQDRRIALLRERNRVSAQLSCVTSLRDFIDEQLSQTQEFCHASTNVATGASTASTAL